MFCALIGLNLKGLLIWLSTVWSYASSYKVLCYVLNSINKFHLCVNIDPYAKLTYQLDTLVSFLYRSQNYRGNSRS